MKKILKENYEQLTEYQDHIVIDIDKYKDFELPERLFYKEKQGKKWEMESKYDMQFAVQTWTEQFDEIDEDDIIYIFGCGSIAYITNLREKFPDNFIIVYEPNEENVIRLLCEDGFENIYQDNKFILIAGEKRREVLIGVVDVTIIYSNLKKVVYGEIPNYRKIWAEEYEEFHFCIDKKIENNLVEKYSLVEQGEQRAQNQIYNIKHFFVESGVMELKKAIDDKIMEKYPVVIVGAGPSLDKNIDILREYQGRALIICVESALNKVMRHGIVPDLNVAVDPSYELGKRYAIEDERCKKIPLVTDVECSWTYIDQFTGRKFYFAYESEFYNHFLGANKTVYLGTGGSVSQNAFSIARYLNAKHIILIGQDLAYPDNKIHADGVLQGEKLITNGNNRKYFYVDGIDGKPVLTEKIMDIYRKWYEEVLFLEKNWHVIDATEGGAKIEGTDIMPLQMALEKYCPKEKINFRKLFDNADYFFTKNEQDNSIKQIEAIYSHIDAKLELFEKIRLLYQNIRELNWKKTYKSPKLKKCMEDVSGLTNQMNSDIEMMLYRMYTNQQSYNLQDELGEKKKDAFDDIENVATQGIELVDAYIMAAKKLKEDWKMFYAK